MKLKLSVPYFKQELGNDCGICCVRTLSGFYGKKVFSKQVLEKCDLHPFGVFTVDLGLFLLEEGFDVDIYSFDLSLVNPSWSKSSETELLERLKELYLGDEFNRKKLEKTISFIECGGRFKVKIPEEKMLIDSIKKKVPVMISVNASVLYDKRSDLAHFVVVNGFTKNSFIVSDPFFEGEYSVSKKKLLFAWFTESINSSGYLLKITPSKKLKKHEKLLDEVEW
jgi:ABC-type bacteriocin/lantibiotic exporter with double-glycine peptidase domain